MSASPVEQVHKVEARTEAGVDEVREYLYRHADPERVLGQLKMRGAPGRLLSGEVCLNEASRGEDDAEEWIDASTRYFAAAWRSEDIRTVTAYTPTAARAALRLAQLPVLRPILLDKQLPSHEVVDQASRDTIMVAAHIGRIIMAPSAFRQTAVKNDCLGMLSEVAVLGLAQRFSLRNNLTDCWQATTALVAAKKGTVQRGAIRDSWDIDIWSSAADDKVEPRYKLQVRSSDHIMKSYKLGIQVVSVMPDLAFKDDPALLGLRIVQELATEQNRPGRNIRLGNKLDRRIQKLLYVVDR